MIRGVIFDLDGTLVDSQLDFEAMRLEMGLPSHTPILEAIEGLEPERAAECKVILSRHEIQGARCATPMDGVHEFLNELHERKMRMAIVTRNSRQGADGVLEHLPHVFDVVITREDGPAKPDPWSILHICERWELLPSQVAMMGDFRFDIEAGIRAGAKTIFFANGRERKKLVGAKIANVVFDSFRDASHVLDAIENGFAD